MDKEVWIALIALAGTIVTGYFSLRTKLAEIHRTFNSKMDILLKMTEEKAKIAGRDEERASVAEAKRLADDAKRKENL